jgi:hypothetical protein
MLAYSWAIHYWLFQGWQEQRVFFAAAGIRADDGDRHVHPVHPAAHQPR